MTVVEQIEEIGAEICNNYCKYPCQPVPEGKGEDWLFEDEDSPCRSCPLNMLY